MKNLFKVALVAVSMLFVGNFANAQTKIGFVNFQAVIGQLPEAKTVQTTLATYQKQFSDQLAVMNNEYQSKGQDYQKNQASWTDAIRTAKQTELQDIQKRMTDYQQNAQQQIEAKANELIKPLSDKAKAALSAVAKEKGYSYVFDSSQGAPLLISPEGDDLFEAVKAKLGIK